VRVNCFALFAGVICLGVSGGAGNDAVLRQFEGLMQKYRNDQAAVDALESLVLKNGDHLLQSTGPAMLTAAENAYKEMEQNTPSLQSLPSRQKQLRKLIYQKNYIEVKQLNDNKNTDTVFNLLTPRLLWHSSERKSPKMADLGNIANVSSSPLKVGDIEGVAAVVDYRSSGILGPVLNQESCGGCWAFAAVGAMQAAYAKQNRMLYTLSPQQLISCDSTQKGCQGGIYNSLWYPGGYCANNGVTTNDLAPFQSSKGFPPTCGSLNIDVPILRASGVVQLMSNNQNTNANMKVAVMQQPVAISIYASCNSFMAYKSGILSLDDCNCVNNEGIDHGVLLVGYDTTGETPYWIIKNSWGPDWGMEGYAYLEIASEDANNFNLDVGGMTVGGTCGINYNPAFPAKVTLDPYCETNDCTQYGSPVAPTTSAPTSSSDSCVSRPTATIVFAILGLIGINYQAYYC